MPEGLLPVIGLLSLGYVLLLIEVFVPGGVLGVLGVLSVAYGCVVAFELGTGWGLASVGLSISLTAVALRIIVRSRMMKKLVLDVPAVKDWKAASDGLEELLGKSGRTLTLLRPAGLAEIGDLRVDVVADGEFIEAGVAVRVCEVEGNRVVVEADGPPQAEPPRADPSPPAVA